MKNLMLALWAICHALVDAQAQDQNLFTAQADRREQALTFLAKARAIARDEFKERDQYCGVRYRCGSAYVGIAKGHIANDDFEGAKATVTMIPQWAQIGAGGSDCPAKDWALDLIAKAEVAKGHLEDAVRTASAITGEPKSYDFPDRHGILRTVIQRHIAARRYEEAVKVARELIPKPSKAASKDKSSTYKSAFVDFGETVYPIFAAMGEAGQSSEARHLAKDLLSHRPWDWNEAMKAIALAQTRAGDAAGAKKWAAAFFEPDSFAFLTSQIAAIQARVGDKDGAEISFREAEKQLPRVKGSKRQAHLGQLIASYAHAGQYSKALGLLEKPVNRSTARLISAPAKLGGVSPEEVDDPSVIAWIAAEAGDFDEAKRIARTLRTEFECLEALQRIAKFQSDNADEPGALETLNEAWRIIRPSQARLHRGKMQIDIFKAMVENGAGGELAPMLDEAFEISKATVEAGPSGDDSGSPRESWLSEWGSVQGQIVKMQAQYGSAEKALAQAGQILDLSDRWFAYERIAAVQASKGNEAEAQKALELVPRNDQRSCVNDMVRAYVRRGAFEEAKRVLLALNRSEPNEQTYSYNSVDVLIYTLLEQGDLDAAKVTLAELAAAKPDLLCRNLPQIARVHLERGQKAEAAAALEQATHMALKLNINVRGDRRWMQLPSTIISLQHELGNDEAARKCAEEFGVAGADPWDLGQLSAKFTQRGEIARVQAIYEAAAYSGAKVRILTQSAEALAAQH